MTEKKPCKPCEWVREQLARLAAAASHANATALQRRSAEQSKKPPTKTVV